MATQIDYYETLEIERTADDVTIKKAFRRLARQYHPDINHAPDAEEKFKQINEAYDVLSNPDKRAQYDQFGSVGGFDGGFGGGGYQQVNIEDLFGDLFSSFFGGVSGSQGGQVNLEGRDMQIRVQITLEEAAEGVTKEIIVDRLAPCDECGATGAENGTKATTCTACKGTGQRVTVKQTFLGAMQSVSVCDVCHGTGSYVEHPCPECEGSGRVIDRETLEVKIPAGIADGQRIRKEGYGEAGVRGAKSGDLFVAVSIKENESYEREGDDLHAEFSLSMTEATLGCYKKFKGLQGEDLEVEIKPGTQSGDTVKVKGAGMPHLRAENSGDLYLHLIVVIPQDLTDRQRELLMELSSELGDGEVGNVSVRRKSGFDKFKDWLKGE